MLAGCVTKIFFILLFLVTYFSGLEALRTQKGGERRRPDRNKMCSPGLITDGYTSPRGDIVIEYGQPLDIVCILYDSFNKASGGNMSSHIYFMINNEVIPKGMVQVINETSAKLHIDKPELSLTTYTCKLDTREQAICFNSVTVGTKPQPVTDFKCISYNYENLTCAFTPPNNYVYTSYNLTYYFPGRAGRLRHYTCPNLENDVDGKMKCIWTISTEPQYRLVQRTFYFDLYMENSLGNSSMSKTFSHFPNVLSGPPENLTYAKVTPSSILLYWTIPTSMQDFPPGLEHRIVYQSEYGEKSWKFGGMIRTSNKDNSGEGDVYFNLTGLKYAHALYDIRVSMRSVAAAKNDENMWSKNSSVTARTASKKPGAPPKTNVGSFEIVSSGNNLNNTDVYVYWQQLPEEIKNGADFTYHIEIADERYINNKPVEKTNAYAKFKNLSITESYTFRVWSQNNVGRSSKASFVRIPSIRDRIGEPVSFTNIAFGDGRFELNWEHPKQRQFFDVPIKNYTIFWCAHDRDRPYQCSGLLKWVEVDANKTVYNITVSEDKIHQFAISANTDSYSSGMVWATCTLIHNKAIGKMKNVWVHGFGSTYIEVRWKLECSDRIGSIIGFVIYYCAIVSPTTTSCKEPERNVTIYGDSTLDKARINNLMPYQTYMMAISVITKHSQSQNSDYLYQTTLEDAPYQPSNVTILQITNDSISLSWKQPNITNGKLNSYEVVYNSRKLQVDSETTNITLQNLESFVSYNISVIACTVNCSEPTVLPSVMTKGGRPSKINRPIVSFQNDSFITIEWSPPLYPGGRNDIYEVKFEEKYESHRGTTIFNVTEPHYNIRNCGSNGKYDIFYISVRAVNVFENEAFEGPWSSELESYCSSGPRSWIWVLVAIGSVLLIILFCYGGNRCYLKIKDMATMDVILPEGLKTTGNTIGDDAILNWDNPRQEDDNRSTSIHDDEYLLTKFPDSQTVSGESSGCGSGHGSATSSLKSGTHISGISSEDSGTEHPRATSAEDIETSLRLRVPHCFNNKNLENVCKNGSPTVASPIVGQTNVGQAGGYCVLGIDMTPVLNVYPTTAVTSMKKDSVASPATVVSPSPATEQLRTSSDALPYVLTGEMFKTNNPGYIPLEMLNSTSSNENEALSGTIPSDTAVVIDEKLLPNLHHLDKTLCDNAESKPSYVQHAIDTNIGKMENLLTAQEYKLRNGEKVAPPVVPVAKTGYVTIGDISPASALTSATTVPQSNRVAYIPHRHFDTTAKSIKED